MKNIITATITVCSLCFFALPITVSAEYWPEWIGELDAATSMHLTPKERLNLQSEHYSVPEKYQPAYYRQQPTVQKNTIRSVELDYSSWPDWIGRP